MKDQAKEIRSLTSPHFLTNLLTDLRAWAELEHEQQLIGGLEGAVQVDDEGVRDAREDAPLHLRLQHHLLRMKVRVGVGVGVRVWVRVRIWEPGSNRCQG